MTAGTTGTTTAGMTTTDAPRTATDARPRRSGVSVRVRITATVALLVALALTGAGFIVYAIESQRLDRQSAEEVDQELDEFARLVADGRDPETGEAFPAIRPLIDLFMGRNVPDDDELLVGWIGDGPKVSFPEDDLVYDPGFRAATAPLVTGGGSTTLDTAQGEVLIASQPITLAGSDAVAPDASGPSTGALVVVVYLDEDRAELLDTMRTYGIVALLSLLAVIAFAFWQSGRLLAPLRTLRLTAEEIGDTDLSRRVPVRGNDDITALTLTVNGMLDRLEDSFAGQRRFLDDAGHELKTPLTVLRGHLELLDVGSREDVEETKGLMLDEVDRMARLVGELILLAKSDRPDFVTTGPVQLGRLTEDLLSKASALGERAWRLDAAAEVEVDLDEQRVTQAVLQLADNAVKHTRPGAEVALGSSYDGRDVRLWVRDTGPGVPAGDRELVFTRFGRSAVPEGDEGFGLGLSIVAAIAEGHGGRVELDDAEPHGARFTLVLPSRSHGAPDVTATRTLPALRAVTGPDGTTRTTTSTSTSTSTDTDTRPVRALQEDSWPAS